MSLQTEVENFLVDDLYTLAATELRIRNAGDVYLDRKTRARRADSEIVLNVERGNVGSRRVGRGVLIDVVLELAIGTVDSYYDAENRPEDRLRAATEILMGAYDADRGAARFSTALTYPVDVVECMEDSDYVVTPPNEGSDDSRTFHSKTLRILIHAYEH